MLTVGNDRSAEVKVRDDEQVRRTALHQTIAEFVGTSSVLAPSPIGPFRCLAEHCFMHRPGDTGPALRAVEDMGTTFIVPGACLAAVPGQGWVETAARASRRSHESSPSARSGQSRPQQLDAMRSPSGAHTEYAEDEITAHRRAHQRIDRSERGRHRCDRGSGRGLCLLA